LTATATPEVRRDIADALELRDPRVFVAGFDRPNLFIEVLRVSGDKDKLGRLVALSRSGGPGIVYAATRKNVEKVVGVLRASEIDAVGYHAGMGDAERTAVQERFVRGEARVIVATNAFGMGVDKADIRFVAHFDVPRSLEAYYQEIGRAGRDGLGSHALLLFNFADVMMQRRMIEAGRPSRRAAVVTLSSGISATTSPLRPATHARAAKEAARPSRRRSRQRPANGSKPRLRPRTTPLTTSRSSRSYGHCGRSWHARRGCRRTSCSTTRRCASLPGRCRRTRRGFWPSREPGPGAGSAMESVSWRSRASRRLPKPLRSSANRVRSPNCASGSRARGTTILRRPITDQRRASGRRRSCGRCALPAPLSRISAPGWGGRPATSPPTWPTVCSRERASMSRACSGPSGPTPSAWRRAVRTAM